ncbi:MAG TPA: methyltransferase domain-containing protein [Candidatus Bathyarchaeia archaeon]|nr:methyltransferase domain-containing protein [Candidatus Bathyarchaeia archaeon]
MSTLQLDEIKQRQRIQWDASAPGWKKWEKHFIHNLQPLTDMLVTKAGIKTGNSVLDLACGTGEPALTIAKIVGPSGRVVGVDLAPGMLAVARERTASQGLKNVSFQINEHDDLPALQDHSFDAAVCRLGLMFMPDPVRMLRAIRRVLKPGGKASVVVWGPPEKAPFFTVPMMAVSKHLPDLKPVPPGTPGGPFGIPSQEMLGGIFTKAGFSNFNSQTVDVMVFDANSPEEYWEAVTETAGPIVLLLSNMASDKRKAVREELIQTLREKFPSGPVKLGGEAIVGTGTKA